MPPTPGAPNDGPVIGGHAAVADFAPPPPAAGGGQGPGVGNMSGLVLMMAVFGAIGVAVFRHLQKVQKRSAMHSAAQKMANQIKAAALADTGTGGKKQQKPKKKGPSESKGSAKFAPLGQNEEEEDSMDVEACGEANTDEDSAEEGSDAEPQEPKIKKRGGKDAKQRKASRDKEPAATNGLSFGAAGNSKHDEDAESSITLNFGDDASAINFGDGASSSDGDGSGDEKPAPVRRRGQAEEEEDEDDLIQHDLDDEDDDISPNDSVSQIGFSKPVKANQAPGKLGTRSAPPRKTKGRGAFNSMPSIGEQEDLESGPADNVLPGKKKKKDKKESASASATAKKGTYRFWTTARP